MIYGIVTAKEPSPGGDVGEEEVSSSADPSATVAMQPAPPKIILVNLYDYFYIR